MRSLWIVSHQGGVGKTTTSVNLAFLAAEGCRVLLVDADPADSIRSALQLHKHKQKQELMKGSRRLGVIHRGILPQGDILTPVATGETAAALADILAALATPLLQARYDLAIFDAPLGWPPTILPPAATPQEVVWLARAPEVFREPQRLQSWLTQEFSQDPRWNLHGVLLTLVPGPVEIWAEYAWADRLPALQRETGLPLLPLVMPHDPEVAKALVLGKAVGRLNAHSPAGKSYRTLLSLLRLHDVSVRPEEVSVRLPQGGLRADAGHVLQMPSSLSRF